MAQKYTYDEAHDGNGKTVGVKIPSREEIDKRLSNVSSHTKALFKDKLGGYKESYGGGQPIPKNQKWENNPEIERALQPRDKGGKFTFNSSNALTLDDKRGSRGTTIPPFLLGANSKIVEVGSVLKTEDGKYLLSTIEMSSKELVDICKQFFNDKQGFHDNRIGNEGATIGRQGRPTKAEQEANPGIIGKKEKLTENEKARMEKARIENGLSNQKVSVTPSGSNSNTNNNGNTNTSTVNKVRTSLGLSPYEDFDVNKDPVELYQSNKKVIDNYINDYNSKNPNKPLTIGKVISAIKQGKIKNPADLEVGV